jgi:hypothetical protein
MIRYKFLIAHLPLLSTFLYFSFPILFPLLCLCHVASVILCYYGTFLELEEDKEMLMHSSKPE